MSNEKVFDALSKGQIYFAVDARERIDSPESIAESA
jgi:hypothetical protein